MATRRKSYSARVNKGKAAEVFVNNMWADLSKSVRDSKAEKEKDRARWAREQKKEEKQREREWAREKEQEENEEKERERAEEKEYYRNAALKERLEGYIVRARLDCEKYGFSVLVADAIAAEAMSCGYENLIEGKIKHWKKRSDEIVEEYYMNSLNRFCGDVLARRDEYHVFGMWDEEFIAAMMDERPASDDEHYGTLNQFNKSSQVYIHYLERTNNLHAVDHWGKEQKQNKKLLGRLFDGFWRDLIVEEPKIGEVEKSQAFLACIAESNRIRKDIDDRLNKHLAQKIIQ